MRPGRMKYSFSSGGRGGGLAFLLVTCRSLVYSSLSGVEAASGEEALGDRAVAEGTRGGRRLFVFEDVVEIICGEDLFRGTGRS